MSLIALTGIPAPELSARPIETESLDILLETSVPGINLQFWQPICDALGRNFLIQKDKPGGTFATYSCSLPNTVKSIAGKDSFPWTLHITNANDALEFKLYFRDNSSPPQIRGHLQLPALKRFAKSFPKIMADEELLYWISEYFKDALPMSAYIPSTLAESIKKAKGELNLPQPTLQKWRVARTKTYNLKSLYRLTYNEDTHSWSASDVDDVRVKVSAAPSDKAASESQVLVLDPAVITKLEKNSLWLHNAQGPSANSEKLVSAVDTVFEALAKPLGEGSAGKKVFFTPNTTVALSVRYGRYLPSLGNDSSAGKSLIAKIQTYSLMLDGRGGWLKGWRLYYDILPNTTATENGLDESVRWQRLILGRSFEFNLPQILYFDVIDATPKLGRWNFESHLPFTYDDGTTDVVPFEVKNALSMAIEVGIEKYYRVINIRGWYARDFAYSFLKGGSSVKSDRFGFDSYFKVGPKFGRLSTMFILSAVTETISLSKTDEDIDSDATGAQINATNYSSNIIYAGLGLYL